MYKERTYLYVYQGSTSGRFGNDIKINQLNLVLSAVYIHGIREIQHSLGICYTHMHMLYTRSRRTGIFFLLFLLFCCSIGSLCSTIVSRTSLQYNGIINYNDKQIAMPIICVSVRSDMWSVLNLKLKPRDLLARFTCRV